MPVDRRNADVIVVNVQELFNSQTYNEFTKILLPGLMKTMRLNDVSEHCQFQSHLDLNKNR
jgi:hypothetical protein